LTVKRFGLAAALSLQAGLNIRGGVLASNIYVSEYDGDKHGIRFDPLIDANAVPSKLVNFVCKPSAVDTTVGVYCNLPAGLQITANQISNGQVIGAKYGVDVKFQYSQISNVNCIGCETGFRIYQHNQLTNVMARQCTVVGYQIDESNNVLTNVYAYQNLLGANIGALSTFASFRNGVFSGNTANVTDAGTQTAFSRITGVNTDSVGTASVDIDSTGEKTITIPHNLSFTPDLINVILTLQRDTNVIDFDIAPPYVFLADATNVYCKVLVKTASATAGAKITLMATCVAKKALRQ